MNLNSPEGGAFQRQVLRNYTALMLLREQWAGALVLSCGLNGNAAALALSAHIAGAVCLSVEPDASIVKAAQRNGVCDFVVNTLDEALRTLKNEVRKGTPLSVGLHAKPRDILNEALERGLLPALTSAPELRDAAIDTLLSQFCKHGVPTLVFDGDHLSDEGVNASTLLDRTLQSGWEMHFVPAKHRSALNVLDTVLQNLIDPSDRLRNRWLQYAHLHFRREKPLGRAAWLTSGELSRLHDAHQIAP